MKIEGKYIFPIIAVIAVLIVALTISLIGNMIQFSQNQKMKCLSDEYTSYKTVDAETAFCVLGVKSEDKSLLGTLTRATNILDCINYGVEVKNKILTLSKCER